MTIECYETTCRFHCCNNNDPNDDGPFCYELECKNEGKRVLFLDEINAAQTYFQWLQERDDDTNTHPL